MADADFCYSSGRLSEDLALRLTEEQIMGRTLDDTIDLLCYRQLHSPILTNAPLTLRPPGMEEFANLIVASCLVARGPRSAENPLFQHPSGYQVEAKEADMAAALERLQPLWPRGLRVGALFPHVSRIMDDLKLLQCNGLIELRCVEPGEFGVGGEPLNRFENEWGDYVTSPYHTREVVPRGFEAGRVDMNVNSQSRGLEHRA